MVNRSPPSDHLLRTQSRPYDALDHLPYKDQGRANSYYTYGLILREQLVVHEQRQADRSFQGQWCNPDFFAFLVGLDDNNPNFLIHLRTHRYTDKGFLLISLFSHLIVVDALLAHYARLFVVPKRNEK